MGESVPFFEERIRTRYLKPIEAILAINDNLGEGVAVVNLQCSLIETIESFYNGWIYKFPKFFLIDGTSPAGIKNGDIFISFFSKRHPFNSTAPQINGMEFYRNVRCGLLHETQTKNGWVIRSKEEVFYKEADGKKIIYRSDFQSALTIVIGNYKFDIIKGIDTDLRSNFIAKFDHICNESILGWGSLIWQPRDFKH